MACGKDDPVEPGVFEVKRFDAIAVNKSNPVKTYAHYMPWYDSPETNNGTWGIHWTMNTQNPEISDSEGKRQIASHFYPLVGPYASADPHLIEYHLLLMKYSGIDGVLIDWYGTSDYNDYGRNRRNSEALIDALESVGLEYAIVYEDRTIAEVVRLDGSIDKISAAREDMYYIEDNYFSDNNYIEINGAPLLLVFGPEVFHEPSDWGSILDAFSIYPTFVTLNGKSHQSAPHSVGEYIWVDQGKLANKYSTMNNFEVFIGGAYPGFLDFYKEGGWGEGFNWSIEHNKGETFRQNLQLAKNSGADYLQLITWNDFGEGTMIEPTIEFGYTMLEHVQQFTGVEYSQFDLEKIFNMYELRKSKTGSEGQKKLDQAFYYLVSLQHSEAFEIIDSLITNQ
jgi:hypothetical protein